MVSIRQEAVGVTVAFLVLCLACWDRVEARPNGAPQSACGSLIPGHPVGPQSTPPPFTVTASADSYEPGDQITVTISSTGGNMIRGFLIQVRQADPSETTGLPVGIFEGGVPGSKLTCEDNPNANGLTHVDATVGYSSLTFKWTAPGQLVGHLVFTATIAEAFETFWLNVKSNLVTDSTAGPIATVPTVEQQSIPDNTLIDLDACGDTKGCIRSPEGCASSDCDVIATWETDESIDYIDFELGRKSSGWIALGLSRDQSMGGDSVTECLRDSTDNMLVSQSYNDGRSNMDLDNPHDEGITKVRVGFSNDQQVCRYRRVKSGIPDRNIFDMTTERFFFILARGETFAASGSSKTIRKTKHTITPLVSGDMIDPSSRAGSSLAASVAALIKAHGAIMIVAWVIASSFGILTARHYKTLLQGRKACGVDIWFAIHRPTMILVMLLTIAAFIMIFVHVSGYSQLSTVTPSIVRAHPVLGIIVTALVIANPIIALFRCHPGDGNRPIFNWVHWAVGTVARILAIITVFLGMSLLRDRVTTLEHIIWVMVGFTILHVLVEIILELHKCMVRNSSRSNDMEMKGVGASAQPMTGSDGNVPTGGFKIFIYLFYIVGVLAFGVTMVVMVAMA